jgi:hypothetical protein
VPAVQRRMDTPSVRTDYMRFGFRAGHQPCNAGEISTAKVFVEG